ncbi:outer membrane beta-barrel protein [Marinoscillum luteum]|uniref:Outer membrane beta-barrel protein n=1 Tax=Marinoscillum luteum TaxID=861051 RepID=A0ABW7NEJ2_9BACT
MKKLLMAFFCFGTVMVTGQGLKVAGRVLSEGDGEPVMAATAAIASIKDTTVQYFDLTDADGYFQLSGISPAFYKLEVRSVGYQVYEKIIRIQGSLELGVIRLAYDTMELDAVEVRGQTVGVIISGDTTAYLSNAYKTNPDASAEDLIRKMPGMIVDGDGVQAEGESVKRILVDGKVFFGDDPSIALKTIPAQVIDRIEVFDQLSEQSRFTGFNDGNTTKTINIITKREFQNGQFGKAYIGAGPDEKYNGGGNINFFNEDQRITLVGLSNNINVQNFSSEDLVGVSSGAERGRPGGGRPPGRGVGSGSSSSDFLTGQQSGISQTESFGVNFTDDMGERLKLNTSYFYNSSDNSNDQLTHQEYFLSSAEDQQYEETYDSDSENDNHRINLRMDYSLNDKTSILFTPRISFQQNLSETDLQGMFDAADGSRLSTTQTQSTTESGAYNLSNDLLIRHRMNTPGRTISLGLRSTANHVQQETLLNALTSYTSKEGTSDTTNQRTDTEVNTATYSANLRFTERIGDASMLELGYAAGITYNDSNKETFGLDIEQNAQLDTTLSSVFESQYQTHQWSTGYMYRKSSMMLRAGLAYEYALLSGQSTFPTSEDLGRSFQNVLPSVMLRYEFDDSKNIRLFYRTNTQEPSVTDLQDVVDNSNPLSLESGNSNLRQSYSHTLMSRYGAANSQRGTSFFAMVSTTQTNHYITSSTFTAAQDTTLENGIRLLSGGQFTQPVNMNGYLNSKVFTTYGLPLSFLSSGLNFNTTLSYKLTPGQVNGQANKSRSTGLGQGLVLSSNISEKVDFTLSYDGSYYIVKNTFQPQLNNNYYYQVASARLNLILPAQIVFRTDFSHQLYAGLSDSYNQQYALWNASIGKKIFSEDRGEIGVSIFDLLGQNTSISREVTETYVQDTQTEVLGTYFMVNFSYNFRNAN